MERQYVSVEELTANRSTDNEEDYELPGVGWIRIRGLSRAEFMEAGKRYGQDMAAQERFILSRCVIIPRVTEADAGHWQQASGINEINKLAMHINEMSGLSEGADKSGVSGA
jgi:hypothetical protein